MLILRAKNQTHGIIILFINHIYLFMFNNNNDYNYLIIILSYIIIIITSIIIIVVVIINFIYLLNIFLHFVILQKIKWILYDTWNMESKISDPQHSS